MQCVNKGVISTSGTHTILAPKPTSSHPSFSTHIRTRTHFNFGSLKVRVTAQNGSSVKVDSEMSYYELLGVPERVTLSDIKKAYKYLARKYHPDVSPPECVGEYTGRFIRVREAYETLSDPNIRALYDLNLARGLHLSFSARKKTRDCHED